MTKQQKKLSDDYWKFLPILPHSFYERYSELYAGRIAVSNGIIWLKNQSCSTNLQETLPFANDSVLITATNHVERGNQRISNPDSTVPPITKENANSKEDSIRTRQTDDESVTDYLKRDTEYAQSTVRDQARALRDLMAFKAVEKVAMRERARFLVVASGKGGVGKSTVALNLGIALSRQNKRVVVVDGDLGLANLDTMLGVRPQKTLWHYINAGVDLPEIMISNTSGIDLLPGGSGLEDLANLSPAQTDRFISALENLESKSDYIIIDTGAGINHRVITFAAAADRVLLVAAPESTSILDAYGLIKVTCSHHAGQLFKVVMCRVQDGGEARRHFEALASVATRYTDAKMELAGYIPNDESVRASVNQHLPLLVLYPRSNASLAFYKLAQTIAQDVDRQNSEHTNLLTQSTSERSGFIKRLIGVLKPGR